MNRKNHALAAITLLSALLGGGLSGCSSGPGTETTATETVSNVAVIVARRTEVPDWLEAVGTVRAAQTSQVASQIMGNVVEIRAHEGDRVQVGQILAVIDSAQPRAEVERAIAAEAGAQKEVSAADSDFALAEATLKRYQQLYERKSVSPQEFDEVKARYQSAEARRDMARAGEAQANAALTQARTLLGYTQIRSPFNGLITEKKVDVGTLAFPGMPAFTMEDTSSYRLEATVNEGEIGVVRVGQPVRVSLDVLGSTELRGRVLQVVPAADPASRSFLVKVELPDSNLRSGVFGRVRFSRGERLALLIPQAAIVERGQLRGVYVINSNQIADLRYVTLGTTDGEQVEVLSGLQGGERLIAASGSRELGGKRIVTQ